MSNQEEFDEEAEVTLEELRQYRESLSASAARHKREFKLCAKAGDVDGCLVNAHEVCVFRKAISVLDLKINARLEVL